MLHSCTVSLDRDEPQERVNQMHIQDFDLEAKDKAIDDTQCKLANLQIEVTLAAGRLDNLAEAMNQCSREVPERFIKAVREHAAHLAAAALGKI